ncbi:MULTISPECIES: caspase family protein [unclassified Coleofasciculus]|uniref:caspase family protein n=1 Tax=unclassified Coleofasciculus TaxID=2692782 RepID=UPI0018827987|nr:MULTISPECIES: caspase family protein [unclassified Coleofasciculus]MBE9124991.1 caspase family protein [Coleofasciculus sp. LEGE 07081]MBE9148015.1 caspase family protein [Coleofasciculus sp. LEGE 07092]
MSPIKRRQFLQFAGSALATIGFSQLDIIRQGDRYGKIMAQDTPRKLALLVGINDYPKSDRFRNLYGCLNDVELQQQLLIHRFGFNKNDILTLTNTQASRQGILDAFNEHLVKQSKPGDVVVFHFSGHGSEVFDPNPIDPNYKLNSTFVPADDYGMLDRQ